MLPLKADEMKRRCAFSGAAVLLVATMVAAAPEIRPGPPASPLSWRVNETLKPGAVDFSPPEGVVGVAKRPASMQQVDFRDEHAFGDRREQRVWMVRYEAIPVRGPTGNATVSVSLNVAFDLEVRGVLCAFTDPAPVWAHSVGKPNMNVRWADKESTATMVWGEVPSRADYRRLRSSLTEVLQALWKEEGIAPDKAGQIILRPRFFQNTWPKKESNGGYVAQYPPGNRWIVEVLGRAMEEYLGQVLTSAVVVFRDGDLTWLQTSPMP